MNNFVFCVSLFGVFSTTFAGQSIAASTTAYVTEFKVSGAPERGDLKDTLQVLLASRLNGDAVAVVGTAAGAAIIVSSSYTQLGKMFSLDAMAKDNAGNVLVRAYEQGEKQDDLIPSVNRLAQKIGAGLAKLPQQSLPGRSMAAAPVPVPAEAKPIPAAPVPPASTDIVRADASAVIVGASKNSSRLSGALSGVALGRTLNGGVRETFVLGENSLSLYHQGTELKQVAQVSFSGSEKALGVDTADLDGDGVPEVYLTLLKGDNLASRVYMVSGDGMKMVAEKLPFYFRALELDGKGKKLYAQEMGTDADFYGDVHLVEKVNNTYKLKNPLKLPRFATIYNFNQFTDSSSGKKYTVVLHEDGYVLVYSDAGEEIWRSSDKFGGSEISFKRQGSTNARDISDQYRRTFLEQRMVVTPNNEIIIPRNGGFFVFGSNRSYKKNTIYAFAWNGATLDERWHTKESQNYLADYAYDPQRKELVLLEVVQKKGLLQNGASAIVVKKVD